MGDEESISRKRPRTSSPSLSELEDEDSTRSSEDNSISSKTTNPNMSTTYSKPLPSSSQHSIPPSRSVKLSPSIFLKPPESDITSVVAHFLWKYLDRSNAAHIEIEGKLGVLVDKRSGQRIRLPVQSEVVVVNDGFCGFDSNMTRAQHANFNRVLNGIVGPAFTTTYKHTRELDTTYRTNPPVRLTTAQNSNEVLAVITKKRLADLEIHLPNSPLDVRISVSTEMPALRPSKCAPVKSQRSKDRLSYTHEAFKVDLTQVKQVSFNDGVPSGTEVITHEVEIEFLNTSVLVDEKERRQRDEPNAYTQYIDAFLNNLRYLSRKSIPHHVL
ncbi:CYTH-like domain-containing protein [Gaertneriomyces semiglobifer]|nr:CYTH-like domain-containing protein [Gaertneriomyces semiglobifer]